MEMALAKEDTAITRRDAGVLADRNLADH